MKSEYKIPLATSSWDDNEYSAIQRVIDSNKFTMGSEVEKFETNFASYFGSKYAVMVNSGSSANLLMVAALRFSSQHTLNEGDEVIVPSVSWSTTYFPLQQYGLRMKIVDIDINTLNYDLKKLESSVDDNTKAIMGVNLLGNPNEYEAIKKIIDGRDIVILEDNCESMGARYNGKSTGTVGLLGTFSTFFSHHISTMEGGVIVTDDEELYHIILALRAHGWTRNLPKNNKVTGEKDDDDFKESFKFVLPGYNLRPLEFSGAIGVEQLKKLNTLIFERRVNAEHFKKIMVDHPDLLIQQEIGESSWFGFSLIAREKNHHVFNELKNYLSNHHIEFRPIVAGNFFKNPVIKYCDCILDNDLNAADHVNDFGLFIGNHHYDIRPQLDIVAQFSAL